MLIQSLNGNKVLHYYERGERERGGQLVSLEGLMKRCFTVVEGETHEPPITAPVRNLKKNDIRESHGVMPIERDRERKRGRSLSMSSLLGACPPRITTS